MLYIPEVTENVLYKEVAFSNSWIVLLVNICCPGTAGGELPRLQRAKARAGSGSGFQVSVALFLMGNEDTGLYSICYKK